MTVSSSIRKAGPFAGNNAATSFPFSFRVFTKADIKTLRVDASGVSTQLVLDSDYSVTLNANQNSAPGGWVTYPISGSPLPLSYSLVLLGDLPYDQETDITNGGGFYPNVIEDMSDRSTIQIQQLAEISSRAITVPEAESASPVLPNAAARAGSLLGFDAIGGVEMMPITTSVGAGDLRNEYWAAGTDYTAGVSTSVTLSRAYGTKANLGTVVMSGIAQSPKSYSLNNTTLTFLDANGNPTPITAGAAEIWCTGGTTLSLFVTPDGSVSDVKVAPNSALYNRVAMVVMVTDPAYGAVGDGVTDDSAAIQAALNSGKFVVFPAGKNFNAALGITVPVTCPGISGVGATLIGPGSAGTVDGIKFNGWYQGGGDQITGQRGQSYMLPNVQGYRYGISLVNAAWVMARCDTVKECSSGFYTQCDTGNYVVECDISIRQIAQCDKGFHEKIAGNTGGDTEGIQGCRYECFYLSACNKGIYRDIAATSVSTYNEYYIVEMDANGCSAGTANAYAILNTAQSSAFIANKYRIPLGPINCNATPSPFSRCEDNSDYDILSFRGSSVSPFAWSGFLPGGFIPVVRPAAGVLNVFVDVANGNDSTGDGSAANPYNTIPTAFAKIQNIDLRGNAMIIHLAPGTYAIGLNLNTDQGPVSNAHIYLRGSGDATLVNVTGGIVASGPTSRLTVEFMTVSTAGIVADNNAKVDFDNVIFGAVGANNHLVARNGATLSAGGPYTINGGGSAHAASSYGGRIFLDGATATLSGTPAFSAAFAQSSNGLVSAINSTFSGGATGARYNASLLGMINTNGGGVNYFPGSSAGSTSTGGVYN